MSGITDAPSSSERATTVPGTSIQVHRFADDGPLKGVPWINASGLPVEEVRARKVVTEIALALGKWAEDQRLSSGGAMGGIFDRNRYIPPDNVFDQMRLARQAVDEDDVVGGLCDSTEGMALKSLHLDAEELDDADVANQWAGLVDLDNFVRMCWRALVTDSQYVAAKWWGVRDFKIKGRMPPKVEMQDAPQVPTGQRARVIRGNQRKKVLPGVVCPLALTLLDSTKVVPIGHGMFGQDRLAWMATREEFDQWSNGSSDPIVARMFLSQYTPTDSERALLEKYHVNCDLLVELNPAVVWRHTLTRVSFRPWPDLRLKRLFRWLDLKQQLIMSDRVALIGNANYILLVRKGEKDAPATQAELDSLNAGFQYIARLPVVVGDHTLKIDIIQPSVDNTLDPARYAVINAHLANSILQTFQHDMGGSSRAESTLTTARAVARGLENRRHGIRRDVEANVLRSIWEHPGNAGKFQGDEPNMNFAPRNINLDLDAPTSQVLLALHLSGDVSRRTILDEVGLDMDDEAIRRLEEQDWYDDIFRTAAPHSSPQANPFGTGGGGALPPGQGGGGRPPADPTSEPPTPSGTRRPRPPRGKNRTT